MFRRVGWWTVALALALGAAAPALGAPGDLEATFGAAGVARVDLGASEETAAVALQPDGQVVVAGDRWGTGFRDAVVARLQSPLGSLDPSYGGGFGWSLLDFGSMFDYAGGLALQADGRIVVVGGGLAADGLVARLLNPEGTFDGSFGGGDGREPISLAVGIDRANAVALRPDGRIVVAGSGGFVTGSSDLTVAQLTAAGSFDASYAGGFGWSRLDLDVADSAAAVAVQPDGRIVVGGVARLVLNARFAIARLTNPAGTFDPSFGPANGGYITVGLGAPAELEDLAIRPDGTIVSAGFSGEQGARDVALVGVRSDGTLDPGFAGDGSLVLPSPGDQVADAIALQRDGKILVAGTTRAMGQPGDILVVRVQPNGTLDTTFGVGGRSVVNLGGNDVANALALQPDGRIVVAGGTDAGGNQDIVVLRLQGDPPAGGGGPGAGGGAPPGVRPRCAGRLATVIGTARRDVLRGTTRADVIAALGGNDIVRGLGGADRVCGGPGRDRLDGGPGADRLLGQGGRRSPARRARQGRADRGRGARPPGWRVGRGRAQGRRGAGPHPPVASPSPAPWRAAARRRPCSGGAPARAATGRAAS